MKFSILVPVYNVEKYLKQCVDSLLNQTYKGDYEIILVDDGSTDSSGRICDLYSREYSEKVKVIHKKNEGSVLARATAIYEANGEYSLFVDSDDFTENSLLEEVNRCLEKHANTDIVVYSFSYYNNGNKTYKKQKFPDAENVYTEENKNQLYEILLSTTMLNSLCTKAVKTEILKSDPVKFENIKYKRMAEDWFMSIHHITAADKIVYLNKHLYNYRTEDISLSRRYTLNTVPDKNTVYVYDRLREYLPVWGIDDEEHIQKLNARWLNDAMYTFSLYYENVKPCERKAVVDYDWSTMLPEESGKDNSNPYENKSYRRLYNLLDKKDYFNIRLYFIKRYIYKKLKKLKSRILK